MKKSIVLATLLAMGATSAFASEPSNAWFGGLEAGNTSADFVIDGSSEDDSGASMSIKVGKYLGNAGRVYALYTTYNTDDNVDLNSYGIGYDYIIYNSTNFKPFIGLNLGYFNYEASGLDAAAASYGLTSSSDSVDISGITYGLNLGSMYEINKNFDIELGARLIYNNADDTVTFSNGIGSADIKGEIDNIIQFYVGVNYNF